MLLGAPYGYRYVKKTDHADAAYAADDTEAAVVRQVFGAYTQEGVSLRAITGQPKARGPTRSVCGANRPRSPLLRNPAYIGRACFGKTAVGPRQQITRRRSRHGRRPTGDTPNHDRPRSEWLEIPVPPLISEATFALAQERLAANVHFAARRRTKTLNVLARPASASFVGHRCIGGGGKYCRWGARRVSPSQRAGLHQTPGAAGSARSRSCGPKSCACSTTPP